MADAILCNFDITKSARSNRGAFAKIDYQSIFSPLADRYSALMISSTIFLASLNNIIVLSR